MHEHDWSILAQLAEGESVDTYFMCGCGKVRHVYTYDSGKIRYEHIHDAGSWTDGYARGIARGQKV